MVQRTFDDIRVRMAEAFSRGDAAALGAFFAEDVRFMPPNMPMVNGRQAFQEVFQAGRDQGMRDISFELVQIEFSGDLAYEVGAYRLNMQPEGGPAIADVGKYVVVFKRQGDGSWMIAADIFNSDSPPPGQ